MNGPDGTDRDTQAGGLAGGDLAAQCRAFVDSTTDIFTHIGPDGEMTYVTSTEAMLGRTQREFIETPLEAFIHPDDKARAVECFESALAGQAPMTVELRFRHGDGHWIWIESSASPIPPGYDLDGVVTVTRDVTERKRQEQELKETQAELEQSTRRLADRSPRDRLVRDTAVATRRLGRLV